MSDRQIKGFELLGQNVKSYYDMESQVAAEKDVAMYRMMGSAICFLISRARLLVIDLMEEGSK